MNTKQTIVHPGQRVIASDGKVYTVAHVRNGEVWAYGYQCLERITVSNDAWGGEHDQTQGLKA
jgi:hypothetical protein